MLPKKRKFDLSKFELERGEAGGAGSSPGPGPGGGSVTVTSVDPSRGHQQRPPRAPEVRALPASGFLTPETVHEAFAGNSYLKPAASSASSSRDHARSLMSGPGPPPRPRSGSSPGSSNNIVDLSHKHPDKHRGGVSVSPCPPLSQYSAFSRHLPFPGALARLQPDLSPSQSTQSFKRVTPAVTSVTSGPGHDPGPGVSVVLEPAASASHKTKPAPAPQHR